MEKLSTSEYKVAIIGSTGVGKSSLCLQFARNKFPENYEPTIEDYYRKQVNLDGEQIMFDIIDTAGQEGNLTNLNALIKQAHGYLLVYDITRRDSFIEARTFRDRILNVKNCSVVPLVLVGNKLDKEDKREIQKEVADKQACDWNCKFWEVSARTKNNLECVFIECARMIRLEFSKHRQGGESCCSCQIF
jgi:small GTP-binding protein